MVSDFDSGCPPYLSTNYLTIAGSILISTVYILRTSFTVPSVLRVASVARVILPLLSNSRAGTLPKFTFHV